MHLTLNASVSKPPLSSLVLRNALTDSGLSIELKWGTSTVLSGANPGNLVTDAAISRFFARLKPELGFYGSGDLDHAQVDTWISLVGGKIESGRGLDDGLNSLDWSLQRSTYLCGSYPTIADYLVFSALHSSKEFRSLIVKSGTAGVNVSRWYDFILHSDPVSKVLEALPKSARSALANPDPDTKSATSKKTACPPVGDGEKKPGASSATSNSAFPKEEAKFVALPGAEMGKVVVRFPPEASGYLHIGHAKAALLNQHYQQAFQGKLILRFDDTNPEKEKEDFERVILEDVAMLNIKPDVVSFTSNFFDRMLVYCEKLIREGKAFVDDTEPELMKKERELKVDSKNRMNSVEKNLQMWEEMKKGTDRGAACCVRAKISMASPNGCMRDPTIYRCKPQSHPKTGLKYKVYPTYDFACPIVDSLEGVTHALRTTEYHDRDEQYFWILDSLGLRKPYIYEYSRLNMTNTVLSKRKLRWIVDNGLVDGWDDPRFPTVRGILRRGLTVEGLKQFILAQGSSKSVVVMEWDKIWAFNKKVIDPVAPRYTCVESKAHVRVHIKNPDGSAVKAESKLVPVHPKNKDGPQKTLWTSPVVLIDVADAEVLVEGQNATFINWGNLRIVKVHRGANGVEKVEAVTNLTDEDFKKTPKITWLAETDPSPVVPVECVFYDNIISKAILGKDEDFKAYINPHTRLSKRMLGEAPMAKLKRGDIIQIQRVGFFICDSEYIESDPRTCRTEPLLLNFIPDGSKEDPQWVKALRSQQMDQTKPADAVPSAPAAAAKSQKSSAHPVVKTRSAADVDAEIKAQGDKVRVLKGQKAEKAVVDVEVKTLLALKAEFKSLTGTEWKPGVELPSDAGSTCADANGSGDVADLDARIRDQGIKVRTIKAEKAPKAQIDVEVKALLALKEEFKKLTGQQWTPETKVPASEKVSTSSSAHLDAEILAQGQKVRALKEGKSSKTVIDAEVKILLKLKEDYKAACGTDWKPPANPPNAAKVHNSAPNVTPAADPATKPSMSQANGSGDSPVVASLRSKIQEQGEKVRNLKESKAPSGDVDKEVQELLKLKKELQELTGENLLGGDRQKSKAPSKPAPQKAAPKKEDDREGSVKHQTRLGLEAKKEENLPDWYTQVITKSEMIEYYDVSGCYIFRPWSYKIWEAIVKFFDGEIKKLGVENCYFPMFVTKGALEKEQTHVADFAPEVAWVTKSGQSDLSEPIAIRPTSETVMYPAYAKWIQSYRDLPIKLNQWNSVVRWEFKHPQPFLRTREFLWQEGHSAFARRDEAVEEVYTILDLYRRVYEELLAIPVICGRKTDKEKFAGGDFTTTTEAFISASGRGIQGATSHHLGQNFSKMFDIVFDDPETGEKRFVYQNSWGLTTRTIGVMVMVHADNTGLVLPPRVAAYQVVIVPCGVGVNTRPEDSKALIDACELYCDRLSKADVRVHADLRNNYSPGWKFNHWELKGVPIRVELGPRDMKNKQFVAVRRDTGEKLTFKDESLEMEIRALLEAIHNNLFDKAKADMDSHTVISETWDELCSKLNDKCIIMAPFCGDGDCEELIKKESARDEAAEPGAPAMGAKSLCIPFEQPKPLADDAKCVYPKCSRKPSAYTLFGRSY